jgi:exodeoxyribonuclease VII small subunit
MSEVLGAPPTLEKINSLIEDGAFEEVLHALEGVVEHLEQGRLTMDESIAWYEAGLGLTRRCTEILKQAELRITTLDAEYTAQSPDMSSRQVENPWGADAR